MRTSGKKQAIRNAVHSLGLHTAPKRLIDGLAQQGIRVDEELVRQVRIEMLKETARGAADLVRPVTSPVVRRRPQGFPRR